MTNFETVDDPSMASRSQPGLQKLPVHALWFASFISLFGNQLTGLAVPWFVLETTGSASRTGMVASAAVIPYIISNFFGGALVDRLSYRGMSVVSDILSAITVILIPVLYLSDRLSFPMLLALMFVGAILDAPGGTARTAMAPPLSKLTGISLERINANLGMITALTTLAAAPLTGVLIAAIGAVNVLWLNGMTFAVSALVILAAIPPLPRSEPSGESFLGDILAGLQYVRNHSLLRTIITGALAINLVIAPLFGVAIPWFANQELHSSKALGIMLGGEGLGALAGAYIYGRYATRYRRRTLLFAALAFVTIPVFPLAFATSVIPATCLLVVVGIGSGMVNPMISTFLQATTPMQYLGRVMGILIAGSMMAQPFGLVLGGAILGVSGFSLFAGGVAVVLAVVSLSLVMSGSLHDLDRTPDQTANVI